MLPTETKPLIDSARNIRVGEVPDFKSQVEQIITRPAEFLSRRLCAEHPAQARRTKDYQ